MKEPTLYPDHHPDHDARRQLSVKILGALLLSFSGAIFGVDAALCSEAGPDGAALFRLHCSACHPDRPVPRPAMEIVSIIRNPRSRMPAFGEDKLSDREVRAIAAYLEHPAAVSEQTVRTEPEPHIVPPATPATPVAPVLSAPAPAPAPRAATPAPAKAVKAKPAETKPAKKKNPPARSFVRTWTIKGLRNNEEVTMQKLQIIEKAKDELAVIPSLHLSDYTVTVTSFEVIDRTMKLQLSWTWKMSPSYWKAETYELSLSDDGKKLSGSLTVRSSGSKDAAIAVWGE